MEINLEFKKHIMTIASDPVNETVNNKHDLKLHYLPASIDGESRNGVANVDKYFEHYTLEENGFLSNSFRGYPLKGCEINVPKRYKGVIFHEAQKPLDEESPRIFSAVGTFDRFTYWNYDKVPTKNDAIQKALSVVNISEALSKDITEEDLEKLIAEYNTKEQ